MHFLWILLLLNAERYLPTAIATPPETVFLPEDEFILPPLLQDFEGDHVLNVASLDSKKRSAAKGEWLEYGDSMDLPTRLGVWIIGRETIQWTQGGAFQGHLASPMANVKTNTPYELTLDRGWMKVWIRPDLLHHPLKVITPQTSITAEQAVFWLQVRAGVTELYLVSGEVKDPLNKIEKAKMLYTWSTEKSDAVPVSKDWDEGPWSVQLNGLYHSFVKISDRAEDAWRSRETQEIYAKLRKKGWKKSSRWAPPKGAKMDDPTPTPIPRYKMKKKN